MTRPKIRTILYTATTSALTAFMYSSTAFAQTTPAELIDLSLEDLLDMNVEEEKRNDNKWEFGITYTKGSFGGYLSGTDQKTFQDVLFSPGETRTNQNYPVVPTYICQNAFSYSVQYNLSNNSSVSISVPHIEQRTEHISSIPNFQDFTIRTKGIGDIAIAYSHSKKLSTNSNITGIFGVRLPTGAINETGDTPRNGVGTYERLPYTMQLGSGTFDLTSSVTYTRSLKDINTGINLNGTLRTGRNSNDYRLGNGVNASVFARYTKHKFFQPGLRLSARHISQIKGGDVSLRVPTAFPFPASITDPQNYGGERINITASVKSCLNTDCTLSVSADYNDPIYQNLNGIQPMEPKTFSLGSSIKF